MPGLIYRYVGVGYSGCMSKLAGLIRRIGVGRSTLLLVVCIMIASILLDVLVHRLLAEPMIEPFMLADMLIASIIAVPVSYTLLRVLVKVDMQREALVKASEEIRMLEELLPVCAGCKKIRDHDDLWHPVDVYVREHSNIRVTHSLCPDCSRKAAEDIPAKH